MFSSLFINNSPWFCTQFEIAKSAEEDVNHKEEPNILIKTKIIFKKKILLKKIVQENNQLRAYIYWLLTINKQGKR